MYQPALHSDQIKALYYLKKRRRVPMTTLAREAVDAYPPPWAGPKRSFGFMLLSQQRIGRTLHTAAAAVEHMGVDHRRPDVTVTEKLLHGPDVTAVPLTSNDYQLSFV